MWQAAAIALGGALGALSRFALNGWALRVFPGFAPAGTLIANLLGCLLIGAVMAIVHDRDWLSRSAQSLMVTGFLGSLTTFSTFGYQTVELLEGQQVRTAFLNVAVNLLVGLAAVWLGLRITRGLVS
ncbi:MAG: fluoride efflux transporter CrcB [Planctomycetota bacterium]|nr:MAG: fluoride efflux transporter CrcB [Planctomycetota bacterium]REK31337.1 MAG: fluoride efflux transporter CrcB [Planctomycetota bacterium]REK39062.1 MAG: fluoride efflux transporter CrcB [Planctomycetota bacterium]